MSFFDTFFDRLSRGRKVDEINKDILGNVIGFYRVDSGVQTGQFILEIANLLCENKKSVCIIDTNPLSDFYTGKFANKLVQEENKEAPSISKRFMNSNAPLSECLLDAEEKLKLLAFGNTAYANVFDMDYNIVEKTYLEAKENFDVVLIDICNMPTFETVIASLKICSKVYSMWGMGVDSLLQHSKLDTFFSIAGLEGKLSNVIINDLPYGTTVKNSYKSVTELKLDFELEIPDISATREIAEHKYILDKIRGKSAIQYAACVDFMVSQILNGSGGKVDA